MNLAVFAGGFWLATWLQIEQGLFWPSIMVGLVTIAVALRLSRQQSLRTKSLLALLFVAIGTVQVLCVQASNSAQSQVHKAAANFETHALSVTVSRCDAKVCDVVSSLNGQSFSAQMFLGQASQSTQQNFSAGNVLNGSFLVKPSQLEQSTVVLVPMGKTRIQSGQQGWTESIRSKFTKFSKGINPDAIALVHGLTIGDDSALSAQIKSRMKVLSLTHLTAVSGANCAIVMGSVLVLLRSVGARRTLIALGSIAALISYVSIVGPEPSVLRAALMAVLVLGLTFGGRRAAPFATLSWAVVGVLLGWPDMASSLGFALSVAATAAILVLAPPLYQHLLRRLPKFMALSLSVVLSAQLWCLPLLFALSPSLPTYAVVANLIVEPIVAPVTVLGVLSLVFCTWLPSFTTSLTFLASCLTNLIVGVSNIAEFDWASIWLPSGPLGLILVSLAVASISLLVFRFSRVALSVLVACVLVWLATGAASARAYASWPMNDWTIVACDVGQGDAIVFRSAGKVALIDAGRETGPVDACLSRLAISHIDLLVLTHFDADHVGGLAGVLDNRTVSSALISPFKDERPLALASKQLLSDHSVELIEVSCCMKGNLGKSEWIVMQPEPGAIGAEDSNDASIVMRFDSPSLTLYTFADAGERAQVRLVSKHPELVTPSSADYVVVKVSHHGSADQYPELQESLHADAAIFSAGQRNSYGHPTQRTLKIFERSGSRILRTDTVGSIAVAIRRDGLTVAVSGEG
ncbi:MAG: hypothetical protein RL009_314 [Actinomycetota bacterium]